EALQLAAGVADRDIRHFNFKHQFHGGGDFPLAGIAAHLEDILIGALGQASSLFRDVRRQQNGCQPFVIRIHASHSSTCLTAGTVISTFSKRTRLTGSRPCTSRTSTARMLRAARYRFSFTSVVTISTLSSSRPLSL